MTTTIPELFDRYTMIATQDRIAKQLNSTGQPSSSIGSNNQHSDSSIPSNVHHRRPTTTRPIRPCQCNSHVRHDTLQPGQPHHQLQPLPPRPALHPFPLALRIWVLFPPPPTILRTHTHTRLHSPTPGPFPLPLPLPRLTPRPKSHRSYYHHRPIRCPSQGYTSLGYGNPCKATESHPSNLVIIPPRGGPDPCECSFPASFYILLSFLLEI